MTIPRITDATIKRWLGETYAQRGKSYFKNGHVLNLRWRGETLTGRVQGSEAAPYRVTVTFRGNSLNSECSCPMDGDCKHVAALLYAAQSQPSRRGKGPSLEERLQQLTKGDLLALVSALLDGAPELEDVIELHWMTAHAAAAAPEEVEERIRTIVAQLNDEDVDAGPARRALEGVVRSAREQVAERRWGAALASLQPLLTELMLLEPEVFDDDRIFTLIYSSAELTIECWRAMTADPENRRAALRLVFDAMVWDLHAGGSELYTLTRDALLKHATPAERDELREWIALAERAPAFVIARASAEDDEDEEDDDYFGDLIDLDPVWAAKELKALARKLAGGKSRAKRGRRR